MPKHKPRTKAAQRRKAAKVMREFHRGSLHSGSKRGPVVRSAAQAKAIAMSESGQSRKRRGRKKK